MVPVVWGEASRSREAWWKSLGKPLEKPRTFVDSLLVQETKTMKTKPSKMTPERFAELRQRYYTRADYGGQAGAYWACYQVASELLDEVERLQGLVGEAESLDSLRNFLGDMSIKMPVGRVIGEVEQLREALRLKTIEAELEC